MIAFVGLVGSVTEYTSGLMNVKQTAQPNWYGPSLSGQWVLYILYTYASVYSMYCI